MNKPFNILLAFLLAFVGTALFAQQNTNTVKGRVIDDDEAPVMFATVCLLNNETIVAGGLTDTTGFFAIKGQFVGEYRLRVSSVGYEEAIKTISLTKGQVLDLGRVVLPHKAMRLDGVEISAEAVTKTVTAERTSINPSATMATATGSVLEVLRGSSAVTIDGSGQVSIRGNSNVLILVDGVPTSLDGLGSIPLANVQSIDIVTSPDARYDSEGSGGVINIISKKQTPEAFTAMASANYGFTHFMNGNVAMSYNTGRWGFRMNYNGKIENDLIESELHRQIKRTGSTLDQLIEARKRTFGQNLGLNVSFKATKKDVLTLDVKVGLPRMNNLQTMHNHYTNAGMESDKLRQTDITFNREMMEGSLGYRHIFQPNRRTINVLASFSAINGHRPSYYYEQIADGDSLQMVQRSESGGHPRIAAFQMDYMAPLGKGKMESGLKMTYRHNNIDHKMYERNLLTDEWQLSIPLSNDLRHREYIPAVYAMWSAKYQERLSMKAGLRMEYSHVTLQNDKDHLDEASDYWFVAPNLMLNYRISEPWQLSFGISRRITRPSYPQLNPYINLIDNQTYETGNIRLKPEKVNKLDFGYSYTGQSLKVNGNAYLNYTQDYINQIAYLDSVTLVMTYINSEMDLKAGVEHNIRLDVLQWLEIDLGANVFFTQSKAEWEGTPIQNQGWTVNSNAALNVKPFRGTTLQAQYFVTTPQYFPQFITKTIHYCNIGIRQQLPKTGLTLSALVTDMFNTRRWDISSDNPVYTLVNTSTNRSRVFWLGVSWNFHSYKPLGGQKKQEEDRSVIRIGE